MAITFEVFSNRWAHLGESPVWSETENCIWWVDTDGRKLLRTDPETARPRHGMRPKQSAALRCGQMER